MKKTMRKSALLSSVAMLIVSAIVLTSATYAWFSTARTVNVTDLEIGVNADTGLLVSVQNGADGTWLNTVSFKDGVAVQGRDDLNGYAIPTKFNPVSSATGASWVKGSYELAESKLSLDAAGDGVDFVAVPFWVTGPVSQTVYISVKFASADGSKVTSEDALKCVRFALADASGNFINGQVVADAAGSYTGTSATGKLEGAAGDAYTVTGSTVNTVAQGNDAFTIKLGDTVSTTNADKYVAYIWLEGNDEDCILSKFQDGEDIYFSMNLSLDAAA